MKTEMPGEDLLAPFAPCGAMSPDGDDPCV